MTPSDRLHRQSGSVLVEAMVAVAIIAMMLAVTYRTVGESVLHARAAETARTAGLIAQSRLATVGAEIALRPGDTTGIDGGFTWRVAIEPAVQDSSAMGELLAVTASVRRRGAATDLAVLRSQRLAPAT